MNHFDRNRPNMCLAFLPVLAMAFCSVADLVVADDEFPTELVNFTSYANNPVFTARGLGHWDVKIRERGWILRDGNRYHMWFTGYDGTRAGVKQLGYATSIDGLRWERHPKNPVFRDGWVEDMMVLKHGNEFLMFAEDENDFTNLLTSNDGVHWERVGPLDVRNTNGDPITRGPYGTPTVWCEDKTWYLFYERLDEGVWLATSTDRTIWTNVRDQPVLRPGPERYDRKMIALNQIIKYKGRYYGYYHGTAGEQKPSLWTTNIATSTDLRNWKKYPHNPLLPTAENKSSGILVDDGKQFRLYTMHNEVNVHFPRKGQQQ